MTAADLVIQELADGEAAALERAASLADELEALRRDHASTREVMHVAVGMLARVTYERDRALAIVYQRAGVPMAPDEQAA